MLKNFPIGSDLTLMNTIYSYPKKDNNNKWDKGSITLIYKDNVTGKKYTENIENPEYEFYFTKPGVTIDNNELFIEKEKVDKISAPYNNIEKTIAELTGNMDFYRENIKVGNRYANKRLHTHPKVFMSDSNIEDHYRFKFDTLYTNNLTPITKTYFDIEADTINMRGDFPELGECPVNAITVIDEYNKKSFTFLLRNEKNPLIEEFEKSINNEMFIELKDFIRQEVGGWKNEKRFGLDEFQYEFLFYDEEDEINLIKDLFNYINATQPDFVLAWNMAFDIPYLVERIKILGYDPVDIICHKDFTNKVCKYTIDERNRNEVAERGDVYNISSYSTYLDQMVHFASRRKGQKAFSSFGLDLIGSIVAKVKKLDYSHITTSIAQLPWKNYKIFVFYNIMDTIVQKCVETKVSDIDYVFGKCLINNTRYNKCHRQTIYLVNRGCKEFYKDDFIIGNNNNRTNEKPSEKFPGAFVADPRKLDDYSKMKIAGIPVNLLNNVDDYDYKSLYPSEMREFNIAPNTQIGKIVIDDVIFEGENPFDNEYFTRGGAFIEDLHSGVYLEFSHRWFSLAKYSDLYKDIIEYHTNIKPSMFNLNRFTREGKVKIMNTINTSVNNGRVNIMKTYSEGEKIKIMDMYTPTPLKSEIINAIPTRGVIFYEN